MLLQTVRIDETNMSIWYVENMTKYERALESSCRIREKTARARVLKCFSSGEKNVGMCRRSRGEVDGFF